MRFLVDSPYPRLRAAYLTVEDNMWGTCVTTRTVTSRFKPIVVGSITGGSYRNESWSPRRAPHKHSPACQTLSTINNFCANIFVSMCFAPTSSQGIFFGSKATAIIDWATAGFHSGFWEYARMHDPIYSCLLTCIGGPQTRGYQTPV